MNQPRNLKTIKIKELKYHKQNISADVGRIQDVLIDNGYYADELQCTRLWEVYSSTWGITWKELPKDNRFLFDSVRQYFEEIT